MSSTRKVLPRGCTPRDGSTIYYTDELTGREDDAHVKNVHLFYRDARNHFKALAHDTHWGMQGPSSE